MSERIVACEVEIEVPFFDVDLMEIVWHGHYLKYFEVARCAALLDRIGYNYMQMRASDYTWPVIDSGIRLIRGYTYQVAVDRVSNEMCYESPAILWKKPGLQKP